MKKLIVLAIIISFFTFISVNGKEIEIALEAELAQKIQAPMIVDDDDVGKGASNGKFIWMEGKPVVGGGGRGWAEWTINLPEAGTYALWGRVIAWDGNSDSFWVTWQPADPNEDAQVTKNVQFRWGVVNGPTWHWDRINHWLDAGTFDREWKFKEKGETVLRIAVREDATMLDAIFVTSNVKAKVQGEANVRLPTKEDIKIQVEGLAINQRGKLTTTWARIKSLR